VAGFFRKLATKAVIRARVALAPKVEHPEGVAPLNEGFFTLERMKKRAVKRKPLKG
jgi:hypothetical protein